jgi:predicted lipid-binding transport protein (Tim44 family)
MNETFDLTTILLLVVAVVIFLRLRSVLGRRTGNERPRMDPYATKDAPAAARERDRDRERDSIITLPRNETRSSAPEREGSASLDDRVGASSIEPQARGGLREIAKADAAFETSTFLRGANAAYEMIVAAYAKGDRDSLGNLLSREVYDSFEEAIMERETAGETTEFSFVGINSATIVEANLLERIAHIAVKFVSEQISAVRDKAGEVIEGDPKKVREVTDIWTFARDIASPNPNWRLIATEAQ